MNPEELLAKALEAMRRDVNHIFGAVSEKKLVPASARDLVAYVKLLTDIQKAQSKADESVDSLSNEELKAHAKALLKESGEDS
jgi:septation ring formation regulator EzrA